MAKLPAIHLYPGDWLRDAVSGCSLQAQGLWLRMMFIMHDSERYGYLSLDGKPMPPESIARRCGTTLDQYLSLLTELTSVGIPSRTENGVIFSRRMVKDNDQRKAWRKRQSKTRSKQVSKTVTSHADVTRDVTPMSHRLSLSSSSSNNSPTEKAQPPSPPSPNPVHKLVRAWKKMLEVPETDGAAWDRGNFARAAKAAKEILGVFGGDEGMAADCMWEQLEEARRGKYDITLETVFRKAPEWKVKNAKT